MRLLLASAPYRYLVQRPLPQFHSYGYSTSAMVSEFPPAAVKPVVAEVAALLKERKETISVAETV